MTLVQIGAVQRIGAIAPRPSRLADQVGRGHARVGGGGGQLRAGSGGAALELAGEEDVGELGVAVGRLRAVRRLGVALEDRLVAGVVGDRGDRDHARRRGLEQPGQQPGGERDVAEVVGAVLQLEAVGGLAVARRRHHPGVVDQQVHRPVDGLVIVLGEPSYGLQRRQVELGDLGRAGDLRRGRVARPRCCGRRARRVRRARRGAWRCGTRSRSWRRSPRPSCRTGRGGPSRSSSPANPTDQ